MSESGYKYLKKHIKRTLRKNEYSIYEKIIIIQGLINYFEKRYEEEVLYRF